MPTPLAEDIIIEAAAHAHRDSEPIDKASAIRHSRSRRTTNRWRSPTEARGSPASQFGLYLNHTPRPYRLDAFVRATVKARTLRELDRDERASRFREIRVQSKYLQAEISTNDLTRDLNWLEQSLLWERLGAMSIEVAALARIFAETRTPKEEVLGR